MVQKIKRAMQNGIFVISDIDGGDPPLPETDEKIWHTSSCLVVTCLHEVDGEAELILGPAGEVAQDYQTAFDGMMETPKREIMLTTVLNEPLLKTSVPDPKTRIRVWRSHPQWAETVVVGWG